MKLPLDSHTSIALGLTGIVVGVVGWLYAEWRLWCERREQQRLYKAPPEPLEWGLRSYLGTVETDDPEGIAIRALHSNDSSVQAIVPCRWKSWQEENGNSAEASPFTLVVSGTEVRVRVDPQDRYEILAVSKEQPEGSKCRWLCTIRAGERVVVSGMLRRAAPGQSGYRGGAHDFTLGPPDGGELSITSEEWHKLDWTGARVFLLILNAIWGLPALPHIILACLDDGQERWDRELMITAVLVWMFLSLSLYLWWAVRNESKRKSAVSPAAA